jgi:hypothetical protein
MPKFPKWSFLFYFLAKILYAVPLIAPTLFYMLYLIPHCFIIQIFKDKTGNLLLQYVVAAG